MGGRLASGVMLTEAPRKGELWTVLVVRQYLIFFLRRRVKVRGTVLKKIYGLEIEQKKLEDDRVVCLTSGEIVQMTMQMNLIFEVQHLTKTYFIQSHIICTWDLPSGD